MFHGADFMESRAGSMASATLGGSITTCMLRCPQCLHMINLLASLQQQCLPDGSQHSNNAPADYVPLMPNGSGEASRMMTSKLTSKSILKSGPPRSPTPVSLPVPTGPTVNLGASVDSFGGGITSPKCNTTSQHVRLPSGRTIRVRTSIRSQRAPAAAAVPTATTVLPPAAAMPMEQVVPGLQSSDPSGGPSAHSSATSNDPESDPGRTSVSLQQPPLPPLPPVVRLQAPAFHAHHRPPMIQTMSYPTTPTVTSPGGGKPVDAFKLPQQSTTRRASVPVGGVVSLLQQDSGDPIADALAELYHEGPYFHNNPLQWPPSANVMTVTSVGTASRNASVSEGSEFSRQEDPPPPLLEVAAEVQPVPIPPPVSPLRRRNGGGVGSNDAPVLVITEPPSMRPRKSNIAFTRGTTARWRASTVDRAEHIRRMTSGQNVPAADDESPNGGAPEPNGGGATSAEASKSPWWLSLPSCKSALSSTPALDDASIVLQLCDVGLVLCSVYLCCFALFLLNAPSRPWLINTTTSTLVLLAQGYSLGWTVLRLFVRNRDSVTSFVVNDTVGETARKYFVSVLCWLDLIVAIPVEWMVLPLLRERNSDWWAASDVASLGNTTTAASQTYSKSVWEVTAAVFSFLMLRHFLRYWRIASLISSSNPIVSERSIFRFLTAVAIALAVVCTCAVAFQAWEGPTLAPLLALDGGKFGNSASANYTALLAAVAGDNFAAVTTPVLFASFDALYWSITTALSVGYGDITPRTPGGRAIAMLTMILGSALLSTMTAIATSYFANKDPVQQELEERKRKMTSMLEYYEVPWELQRDVIASFPAVMEAHSRAAFLDMIGHLPEICRERVESYSRLRLLRRIHLFDGIEREHAFMLARCLTQHFVAAQDVVVQQGELGNEMYFVVQGMLDVLVQVATMDADEHIVLATIRDGSFFGERGLLEDTPRASTVTAITLTELLVLTRADFQEIVASVPEIMDVFRRNVFKVSEEAARAIAVDASEMMWLRPKPFDPKDASPAVDASLAPKEAQTDRAVQDVSVQFAESVAMPVVAGGSAMGGISPKHRAIVAEMEQETRIVPPITPPFELDGTTGSNGRKVSPYGRRRNAAVLAVTSTPSSPRVP